MARRLAGRSVGVVLSGGGARAFAHLGVLDVLLDAGMLVDRVGGVSMGAFIGGLLAAGHDSAAIDACCYEEWVRRNPINDYTLPRSALIKGHKAEAMLERVFGDVRLEELARSFYCASVNLRGNRLVIDRDGPMMRGGRRQHLTAADRTADASRAGTADRRLAARQPAAGADEPQRRGTGPGDRHQGRRGAPEADGDSIAWGLARERATIAEQPSRAPAFAARDDGADRPALERQHRRVRAPARRHDDPRARLRRRPARVSPDRRGARGRTASRLGALEDAPEWLLRGLARPADHAGRRTVVRV